MVYIGPSAHAAGISLEETAAMVGILSNKGIEGSQAGTALRGALTRLIKPSKQNVQGFKELGINVADFKKGTLTLPDMLDKIKNNTKGWTKEQRASAVALAFGTEAQSGMNALISAGGGELRKYTKYAENSAGSTKKIAESMNNTQAAKIKRFQQALHVLSIDIGEKLLPAFEPILTKADQWINKFDNMSDHTQSLIVKAGLLAVALGPTASILGRVLTTAGKFGQGIVKVKGYFAALRAGKDAMNELGIGSKAASTGLSQVEQSAVGSAGKVGALGTSFRLLNPYVLGATVAIGAGITVWELWGKKAAASAERTSRWGTDVGATADTALTKFKGTSTGIDDALNDLDTSFSTSTKSMSKAFDTEFSDIEKSAHDHMKGVEDSIKGLDPEVAAAVEKQAQKNKQTLDKINADAKAHNAEAQAILKNHNGKIADLNDDERQLLKNDQFAMQQDELKALNITGSKKKLVMANLNRDYSKMSQAQRDSQIRDLDDVAKKTTTSMAKQQRALKKALDSGRINQSEYNKGMKALGDKTSSVLDKAAAEYIKLERASGKSTATIKSDMLEQGLSYQNGMKYIKQHSNAVKISAKEVVDTTGKMSKATRKAGEMWNKLVFDPKTGEVKTNAQEEVNKAVKSGKQWNQIKLLAKKGKLTTNAKEMVATAAISQGKWDGMTWKEQKALIRSEGSKDLVKLMEDSGEWNDLSIKEKTALVNAKGQKEIADLLMKTGIWNDLTVEEKTLVLKNSGTNKLYDLLDKLDLWNKLTIDEKTAVISGDDKGIANMLVRTNQWNSLSLKQQQAYVGTKGGKELSTQLDKIGVWNSLTPKEQVAIMTAKGKPEMVDALVTAGVWNNLSLKQKQAEVKSKGTVDLIDQLNKMGQWNNLDPEAKNAIVKAKGSAELGDVLTQYNLWGAMPSSVAKQIIAEDKASGNVKAATDAVDAYNKAHPGQKKLTAFDQASGPLNKATDATNIWRKTPTGKSKKADGKDDASKPMGLAKSSVDIFRKTSPGGLKNAKGKDSASGQMNKAKGGVDRFRGTSPGGTKSARGSDNASSHMNSARSSVNNWRGTSAGSTKTARARNAASTAASAAIRAIKAWNAVSPKTHVLTSIVNTVHNFITKHKKNATGTNFHPGGVMEVNDQPGHVFREMVRYPNGESFIPRGRNVFLNAPAGTQVLRADLTAKKFRGLPQYAKGIGDNTRLLNQAVDVTNELKNDGSSNLVSVNNDNADVVDALKEQTKLYRDQIDILSSLLSVATGSSSSDNTRQVIREFSQKLNTFSNNHNRGRLT